MSIFRSRSPLGFEADHPDQEGVQLLALLVGHAGYCARASTDGVSGLQYRNRTARSTYIHTCQETGRLCRTVHRDIFGMDIVFTVRRVSSSRIGALAMSA